MQISKLNDKPEVFGSIQGEAIEFQKKFNIANTKVWLMAEGIERGKIIDGSTFWQKWAKSPMITPLDKQAVG